MYEPEIRITSRPHETVIEVGRAEPRSIAIPAVLDTTIERVAVPPPQLEWSATLCDGKNVDYATAEKACAALGEGWRLPTRQELESILDLTRHKPAIDTARFPDTKSDWYWTSTPYAWSPDFAWFVCFGYGNVDDVLRDSRSEERRVGKECRL